MSIFHIPLLHLLIGEFQDEVDPKEVHAHQHAGHRQQRLVLEVDHMPNISWKWGMRPHFSKDTCRIDDGSEVDPRDEHSDEEEDH